MHKNYRSKSVVLNYYLDLARFKNGCIRMAFFAKIRALKQPAKSAKKSPSND